MILIIKKNTTRCGKLLNLEMNTSSTKKRIELCNNVIDMGTIRLSFRYDSQKKNCHYLSSLACKGFENSSETKRGEFYRGPFKNSTDNID